MDIVEQFNEADAKSDFMQIAIDAIAEITRLRAELATAYERAAQVCDAVYAADQVNIQRYGPGQYLASNSAGDAADKIRALAAKEG